MKTVVNNLQVASNGDFIYPAGGKLTKDELLAAIAYNRSNLRPKYKRLMKMYLAKDDRTQVERQLGPDNHLIADLPRYLVDTFTGYFAGIPPIFTIDDKNSNEKLQDWLGATSFVDKLNEVSKQVDVYGRSYLMIYQNEEAKTNLTVLAPTHAFLIYDDTVDRAPIAFVRYSYDALKRLLCDVYYTDEVQTYNNGDLVATKVNVYKQIPAVEFHENSEKTGLFEPVVSLIKALDKGLSQKANQIEYFDNAYLSIIGANFPKDPKTGKPIVPDLRHNRLLILNPTTAGDKPEIKFLAKPDADGMQENYLNRITKLIYQITMIPDPDDQNFGQNTSGVAMKYKYQPMSNKAATKERKFIQSLRQLFKVVFSTGTVIPDKDKDAWQTMKFTFTRNVPEDLDSAVKTAKDAEGLVSKQTQLSLLPFVQDPADEIQQVQKEQREQIENVRRASGSMTDAELGESDD